MAAAYARLASDRESLHRFATLRDSSAAADDGRPVELRVRPLGGELVRVRPGTSDPDTLWDAFVRRYHLPPPEVAREPVGLIWDLGANVGLTAAHLLVLYPDARVVAVELDSDNLALARANCAPWADRIGLVEAAVWPEDGEIRYHGWSTNTSSYRVAGEADSTATVRRARAVSLNSLLADERPTAWVDYVKMDIEGAEQRVLGEETEWASRVRAIKVETHPPYTPERCADDLAALGFRTRPDRWHGASVIGVRTR